MIVVEHSYSVNFIDKNDIFLGYEMSTSCCEYPDWYISYNKPDMSADIYEIVANTCIYRKAKDENFLDGYEFVLKSLKEDEPYAYAKAVHPEKDPIYVCIFNEQNGYYSHEYLFGEGKRGIHDTMQNAENKLVHCELRSINTDGSDARYGNWPKAKKKINEGYL